MKTFSLKSFLKFLDRNKLYTTINVFGFAVALSFVILMASYVMREISVDDFQEKKDRIFRLTSDQGGHFAYPVGQDMQNRYPEIENHTIVNTRSQIVTYNDSKVMVNVMLVDSSFFNIFSYTLSEGSKETALQAKTDALVSKEFAHKMFGTDSPIGKTFKQNTNLGEILFTVTGILNDFGNSLIKTPEVLIRSEYLGDFYTKSYNSFAFQTFLLIHENADLSPKLPDMLAYCKENYWIFKGELWKDLRLEPLKEAYFSTLPPFEDTFRMGNWKRIGILTSIGLLILIFAVINYINLSVAQAGMRAKEMATRRLLGGTRRELFMKLITESVLLCAGSFLLALFLSAALEPTFNNLLQTNVSVQNNISAVNILYISLFIIALGTLAGIIPATVISNYRPIEVVRGTFRRKTKMVYSKVLITFQYFITIVLIGCTFTMSRQIKHMLDTDLGYDKDNLIYIQNNNGNDPAKMAMIRGEISKIPGVELVSLAAGTPVDGGNNSTDTSDPNRPPISYQVFGGDSSYFTILGLEIIRDNRTSDPQAVWLNEAALKTLELTEDASEMKLFGNPKPIAGIVKDFNFRDLTQSVGPAQIFRLSKDDYPWGMLVKISGHDQGTLFKQIEKTYSELSDGVPCMANFVDQSVQNTYDEQIRLSKTIGALSIIAVIIASLGILAMATYYIQQRSLEIAVRKVYGSTKAEILNLLVFNFIRLVLIAFIVAIPVIWYFMKDWLAGYTVHISLNWTIFAVAGTAVATVALLTVFWQSWKASNANPVESLKR